MTSKNPSTVDLRGVDMPEHLKMATQAVEYAVKQGEIIVFTDRDIVMKYLPTEAAKNHLNRSSVSGWDNSADATPPVIGREVVMPAHSKKKAVGGLWERL